MMNPTQPNPNAVAEMVVAFVVGFILVYAFKPPTHTAEGKKIRGTTYHTD